MELLSITACILTIALFIGLDYSLSKKPYDQKRKKFNWRKDWWEWRNDNVIVYVIVGLIAGFTSDLWAVPVINKYLDWPELAESMTDLGAIVVATAFGIFLVVSIMGKPKAPEDI